MQFNKTVVICGHRNSGKNLSGPMGRFRAPRETMRSDSINEQRSSKSAMAMAPQAPQDIQRDANRRDSKLHENQRDQNDEKTATP